MSPPKKKAKAAAHSAPLDRRPSSRKSQVLQTKTPTVSQTADSNMTDNFMPFSELSTEPIFEEEMVEEEEIRYKPGELCLLIQGLTALFDLEEKDWTPRVFRIIEKFIRKQEAKLLTIYFDENTLRASLGFPQCRYLDLQYFFKTQSVYELTGENFRENVVWGTLDSNPEQCMYTILERVYAPLMFNLKGWPRNIKDKLCSEVTNFLSDLAELRYNMLGLTGLYIPIEASHLPPEEAAQDTALVTRMDSVVLKWITQVRATIYDMNEASPMDATIPIEEYQYWKLRLENLCGLWKQLKDPHLGHICRILIAAQSPYIKQFLYLIAELKEAIIKARSCVQYLHLLVAPCRQLARVQEPQDITPLIPKILFIIRYIWVNSEYYNTNEQLLSQCIALSNQIVTLCQSTLDLKVVFEGKPKQGIAMFKNAIDCCTNYKLLYDRAIELHNKNHPKPWIIDKEKVFNQVDTIMQRCVDMVEICQTMTIFGRIDESCEVPKPQFGWTRASEFETIVDKIENQYTILFHDIQRVQDSLLQLNSNDWPTCMALFREGMREIEVIIENLMECVFETVRNVEEGLEALQILYQYSKRPNLYALFERQTTYIYKMFLKEVVETKHECINEKRSHLRGTPRYGGRAMIAHQKRKRLGAIYKLLERADWLPESPIEDEVRETFFSLDETLKGTVTALFAKWLSTLPPEFETRLQIPLLYSDSGSVSVIHSNVDRLLLETGKEYQYWQNIGKEIPPDVSKFMLIYNDLAFLNKQIESLCTENNKLFASLSNCEKLLFKEHLKNLEKQLSTGFSDKTTWAMESSFGFVNESATFVSKLQEFIDEFKASNLEILNICNQIACTNLASFPMSVEYDLEDFVSQLKTEHEKAIAILSAKYKEIFSFLLVVYDGFSSHLSKMRAHWVKYIERIDALIELSFRMCIRRSLEYVYSHFKSEQKSGRSFFIRLCISLKNRKIVFAPSVLSIAFAIKDVFLIFVTGLEVFPRLYDRFSIKQKAKIPPYAASIIRDQVCQRLYSEMEDEIFSAYIDLQNYLASWLEYKGVWEIDKDHFIMRYERRNPSCETISADINKYFNLADEVNDIEPLSFVHFFYINAFELKDKLIKHCAVWHKRLTYLLMKLTAKQIEAIYKYCTENVKQLVIEPTSLDQLPIRMILYRTLRADVSEKEKLFPLIQEQLSMLLWFKDDVPMKLLERQYGLASLWANYLLVLNKTHEMLDSAQDKFKGEIIENAADFKTENSNLLAKFMANGPFTDDWTTKNAFACLKDYRNEYNIQKKQEEEVKMKLGLFNIAFTPSPSLPILNNELNTLMNIWTCVDQWNKAWNHFKQDLFWSINPTEMDLTANTLLRKFNDFFKEHKGKGWTIIDNTKQKIETIKKVLPLINDLKNPALLPRHWNDIKELIGRDFDETDENFTLELVIELNMQNFAEAISEISSSASMEANIGNTLKGIENAWKTIELDFLPFKDKGIYRLRGVDNVFATLDEHQTALSGMKGTRYVRPYLEEVEYWEKNLTLVQEVLETMLIVQKEYLYLENIFSGEDIRKQLPKESDLFDRITFDWKGITKHMYDDKYAFMATHYPGLLKKLSKLINGLEHIQRALEKYLETKRHVFPRFYFISNDDLLEILGNSKKPELIQPHLKKLFDNIVKVSMEKHNIYTRMEASGMYSAEGEYIPWNKVLHLEGPVEIWLNNIESIMRTTLRDQLKIVRQALMKNLAKRDKWLKENPGQLCITASQIRWTIDTTRALMHCKILSKTLPLKRVKKRQSHILSKFSEAIRTNLPKVQRLKIVALVTIEIHARDVIDKLYKNDCMDMTSFEWLSQLRFYWDKDVDDCIVKQTNTHFVYGYEYLGNSGRLVITPLTDRCYITLTTALHLYRGGSPKGPAGTGKTETVKDLGKALAYYVIVINCSEGLDFKTMGKMFSGFAQTGAWGCFDEFNRINVEVLSVVAQQIWSILVALSYKKKHFSFEGAVINLVSTCGIFVTMNPGYAGRTELPDNLKSMFRPISMMVPDSMLIAEITLFGEGFKDTRHLAKKVDTLFNLTKRQLSKQDHYDFGLRGMVTLLRYAGRKRREYPEFPDEEIVLLAMKDMNVAKLTSDDLPLFTAITNDLFPSVRLPVIEYEQLQAAIKEICQAQNKQMPDVFLNKIIQLYETKESRHSVMIVGAAGAAKSTVWKTLRDSMCLLKKKNVPGFEMAREYVINPKALSLAELYGEFNLATNEWADGVLSNIMRGVCAEETPDLKWVLFDGPVDAVWIENMNSVMDDNKVLTLINSDRITMPPQVSLLFEVEDLAVASPATVSRCGMVFNDSKDFSWEPFVESWLQNQPNQQYRNFMKMHFDRYVNTLIKFKRTHCTETVPIPDICSVATLCKLLEILAPLDKCWDKTKKDYETLRYGTKVWFLFCLTWSVGATVNEAGRQKMDVFFREMEGIFPIKDTIYEYFVNPEYRSMQLWEDLLPEQWDLDPEVPFFKITVPCVDTIRYNYLTSALLTAGHPVLILGVVGTGKTSTALSVLDNFDRKTYSILTINLSAQSSSNTVQETVESKFEKRTKTIHVPIGGKLMITFMDDFNLPAKEVFGAQPPLELIRQWLDYGFWYNRKTQLVTIIKDMTLMAAMGPPGGGRNSISKRLISKFSIVNMTFPTDEEIERIYGTMLGSHLQHFPDKSIIAAREDITHMTIALFKNVVKKMLPTPTKIHYLFNLRDISKVFQGLLRSNKDVQPTKEDILRLWVHESFRVFSDRLVDEMDRNWFLDEINVVLGQYFETLFHHLCHDKAVPIFCDFLNTYGYYEMVHDVNKLKEFLINQVDEYNQTQGSVKLDMVFYREAIENICSLCRIISQPRGHALLIGIGGAGRATFCKVASFLCNFNNFKIVLSKKYGVGEFKEDLKRLYYMTGVKDIPTAFTFNDGQVYDDSILVIVNNILSTGEVTNLYKPEELDEIKITLADEAKRRNIIPSSEGIYELLLDHAKTNLHLLICMSPVGEKFRTRLRQFPSFVSCTTIMWLFDWPKVALLEVAYRSLTGINFSETISGIQPQTEVPDPGGKPKPTQEQLRHSISSVFATIHMSVLDVSRQMLSEMKRHNYVTPNNYLEFVAGYKKMLSQKREDISLQANKLRNGLSKLDDTRVKVQELEVELEEKNEKVNQTSKECDDYLVMILSQKKEADEAQKSVTARSIKIAEEEVHCKQLAEVALADLNEALPALEEAMKALDALNKRDIAEVRSYGKPPAKVEMVLEAVMILKGAEPTWTEAKRQLGDVNFLNQLRDFDKDHIPEKVLRKIGTYTNNEEFVPEKVGQVSFAAESLAKWVKAIEQYGKIYRVVAPKKAKLEDATANLKDKQKNLADAREKMEQLNELLDKLQNEYQDKVNEKEDLIKEAEELRKKLERAAGLVDGLAGERGRWESSVITLDIKFNFLPGDCLLATAFVSYMGPFLSFYREKLLDLWINEINEEELPCSPDFKLTSFIGNEPTIHQWNKQGLPSDNFSSENGLIITSCNKWPLVIDPQSQAWKWIKNMEAQNGLKIVDFGAPMYLKILETAMKYGSPVLIQNAQEFIDPNVIPQMHKIIVQKEEHFFFKVGDKLIDYNHDFRLFITTKLNNPHYPPEICTKTTVVNFAIKTEGLQAQLLGIVVRKEKPKLEEDKEAMAAEVAAGRRMLIELEDELLRLLMEAKGSILDDDELYETLESSKQTSIMINEHLKTSLTTEAAIDAARNNYSPCARRAALLFFILKDLSLIDPMYQFSLEAYNNMFVTAIEKSKHSEDIVERIKYLNDYHTYFIYKNTCRGLFERHKLMFSFLICSKILDEQGKLKKEHFKFLLQGGVVLNRDAQISNPCDDWLPSENWDNISELDKISGFHGIVKSFEQYSRDWRVWFFSAEPENKNLIGEWNDTISDFQKLLLVRSIRADRLSFSIINFIQMTLGPPYVEPPVLDINQVLEDSHSKTPLIFVLSPGVDPSSSLTALAEKCKMTKKFHTLSLGQGQAPVATKLIEEGIRLGFWVFLANCHLSLSWMPALDKLVEQLQNSDPHKDFRLWLSSSPHPDFPLSILQSSLKMTTEPPKGVKANMKRLYNLITDAQFSACKSQSKFKRLLFALVFFHAIILERKKFGQLGWNVIYSFNDSDFEVSHNLLAIYLDEYEETPWDALKYLIAGVCYGGHVTDEWDRRLLLTYINSYFNDDVINEDSYRLSPVAHYVIPLDTTLGNYREFVNTLPALDKPELFGQHPNADITSLIIESRSFCSTLMTLQVQDSAEDSAKEERVLALVNDVLTKLPSFINYELTFQNLGHNKSALSIVLLQEIQRYNILLEDIKISLDKLQKAIKGFIVMSMDLEEIFVCIYEGRVPRSWLKAYPSLFQLGAWSRDLTLRVEHFAKWASTLRQPVLFWLSAFIHPTGFLTAVLQTTARKESKSVDTLTFEFVPQKSYEEEILFPPEDGVYVRGMFLEGGSWNKKDCCLIEPVIMELVCPLPVILFKPCEQLKRKPKGLYECPVYYYPIRSGSQHQESYVVTIDLKCGSEPSEFWVKRGTASLLSLQ
ncbi:dynein heavy chain 2, axonemal isoform X2 [Cimex lectularius]|uniref:Dynein-1, subspecies f n=1 Tax=Cimex lectularius TaxID=79782 RepID=A0A8I6RLQ4_CIMLE|nr:dynein heavy chain 2, axonemal isoform X2 [Cimex lectularius]